MAKRARGSHTRPGQRAPIQRTAPRPAAPEIDLTETALAAYGSESTLTDADITRAAELEAQIVAQEKVAEAATATARAKAYTTARPTSTLAQAASDEYAYVARDVRRIALIGGSLVALLFGAWALVSFTGLGIFH